MVIDDTWEIVKLGDEKYFKIIGSGIKKFLNSKDYLSTSSIDYNVIKQVEETITFKNRPSRANMQPVLNSVWFARMKDTIKVYSFTKNNQEEINKYILSTGFAGIKCLKEIDPDYLKFYFLSDNFNKQKNKLCSGSTQKAINNSSIKKISVPLPPLPVQKRIVSILEKAERLKERRKKANDETNKIIQSVFYEMFGDPVKNEKGFSIKPFQEFAEKDKHSLKRGPFGGSLKKEIFVPSGYKVYEQKNAIQNNFKIGSYYITKEKYEEMLPFSVKPDDLIISCSGTIGKIAIVPHDAKKGVINQALLKITPNKKIVLSIFLKYLLETESVQREFFGSARGSGIKNVAPMSTIKKTKLICPPLQLQLKFASVVKKIESMKERQKKSTEDINQLFDALMSKAFKGELA